MPRGLGDAFVVGEAGSCEGGDLCLLAFRSSRPPSRSFGVDGSRGSDASALRLGDPTC